MLLLLRIENIDLIVLTRRGSRTDRGAWEPERKPRAGLLATAVLTRCVATAEYSGDENLWATAGYLCWCRECKKCCMYVCMYVCFGGGRRVARNFHLMTRWRSQVSRYLRTYLRK